MSGPIPGRGEDESPSDPPRFRKEKTRIGQARSSSRVVVGSAMTYTTLGVKQSDGNQKFRGISGKVSFNWENTDARLGRMNHATPKPTIPAIERMNVGYMSADRSHGLEDPFFFAALRSPREFSKEPPRIFAKIDEGDHMGFEKSYRVKGAIDRLAERNRIAKFLCRVDFGDGVLMSARTMSSADTISMPAPVSMTRFSMKYSFPLFAANESIIP